MLQAVRGPTEGSDTVSESFLLVCDDLPHSVVLTDAGPRAIEIVKLLHRRTGQSLWHCKSLISHLPATVLENVPEEVAAAMVAELHEAGAGAHGFSNSAPVHASNRCGSRPSQVASALGDAASVVGGVGREDRRRRSARVEKALVKDAGEVFQCVGEQVSGQSDVRPPRGLPAPGED
ncbi:MULTISPECIES: ribosomal protein L7/L12 [unclassified Streptomyces]|uniref:ribosomal protein L7/L12 n=1 Tax=unclassified Streptomyces TaxID=2593676 RepID=UPI0040430578